MSARIILVTGPRGSGKSQFAETHFFNASMRPLYVGTLPTQPAFAPRIEKHRRSRHAGWMLVENIHDTPVVWNLLRRNATISDGILLDGASSLLWTQVCNGLTDRYALKNFFKRCIDALLPVETKPLVFVDCEVPFPEHRQHFWFNDFMESIHHDLSARAECWTMARRNGTAVATLLESKNNA